MNDLEIDERVAHGGQMWNVNNIVRTSGEHTVDLTVVLTRTFACPCECNSGGFCGGCGHAGCGGRR